MHSIRRSRALVASAIVLSALAFTACSPESVVKTVTGGQVDVDSDSGKVKVGDTTVDVSGQSLPDGFPSDIPLPDAPILSAATVDGSFFVNYTIDGVSVVKDIQEKMLSAGYTSEGDFTYDGGGTAQYSKGSVLAGLIWGTNDGSLTLSYTVGPKTN